MTAGGEPSRWPRWSLRAALPHHRAGARPRGGGPGGARARRLVVPRRRARAGAGWLARSRGWPPLVPAARRRRARRDGVEGVSPAAFISTGSPIASTGSPARRRAPARDHARQPHRRLRRARARCSCLLIACAALSGTPAAARAPDPAAGSGGRPAGPAARGRAVFARHARPGPRRGVSRRAPACRRALCGSLACSSSPGSCSGSRAWRWRRRRWSPGAARSRSFSSRRLGGD